MTSLTRKLPFLFVTYNCVLGDRDIRSICGNICPDNWVRFQGSCYFIGYNIRETFVEAAHFCRQHHGHLIHINSGTENTFIKSVLQKTKAEFAWIGLQDIDTEGLWRWYDDNEIATFTDWLPGHPEGSLNENCALIDTTYNGWDDYSCTRQYLPICEREMVDVNGIVG